MATTHKGVHFHVPLMPFIYKINCKWLFFFFIYIVLHTLPPHTVSLKELQRALQKGLCVPGPIKYGLIHMQDQILPDKKKTNRLFFC